MNRHPHPVRSLPRPLSSGERGAQPEGDQSRCPQLRASSRLITHPLGQQAGSPLSPQPLTAPSGPRCPHCPGRSRAPRSPPNAPLQTRLETGVRLDLRLYTAKRTGNREAGSGDGGAPERRRVGGPSFWGRGGGGQGWMGTTRAVSPCPVLAAQKLLCGHCVPQALPPWSFHCVAPLVTCGMSLPAKVAQVRLHEARQQVLPSLRPAARARRQVLPQASSLAVVTCSSCIFWIVCPLFPDLPLFVSQLTVSCSILFPKFTDSFFFFLIGQQPHVHLKSSRVHRMVQPPRNFWKKCPERDGAGQLPNVLRLAFLCSGATRD